jgi:Glutamine synthetase
MITEKSISEAKKYISDHEIDTIEIGFADVVGAILGKQLPARFFLKNLSAGTGICRAPLTWDIQNDYFSTTEFAGFKYGAADMNLIPDLSTLREVPWRKGTATVLSDLHYDTGELIQVAPRQILKNVLARLEKTGYKARVGSEIEFYLLDGNRQPLFGGQQTYSLFRLGEHSELIKQIKQGLENYGIGIEAIHTEYGPGQMELILEYDDALAMADKTVLARNAVKEIARKNGLYATFMAKPWSDKSGSGYHLHQSLADASGNNAFAADKQLLENYAAGLLKSSGEFMALACPSVNSYKRLSDMSFAPTRIGWAYDNRTVSTRLIGSGKSLRLEQRTGAADANAYFLIAASIASGIYGIENRLTPPPLITGNGYSNEILEELPRSLTQAAPLFAQSKKASEYFGHEFVEIFTELINHDIEAHHINVSEWERDRYLENS